MTGNKIQKINFQKKCRQGFSLIEVLVALMVLSIGMVSVAVLLTGSIKTSTNSKSQIIASGLAQEGVELVRNFKDNSNVLVDGNDYRVDKDTLFASFANNVASDKKLYLKSGFLVHDSTGSTSTKFLRKISIATDPNGKLVTSFVSWNGNNIPAPAMCNVANKCTSVASVLP